MTVGIDGRRLRAESYFGVGLEGTLQEGSAAIRYRPWLVGMRACVWVREWPRVWNGLGLGPCLGLQVIDLDSNTDHDTTNISPTFGALLRLDATEVVRIVTLAEVGLGLGPGKIEHSRVDLRTSVRSTTLLFETSPVYALLSLRIEFATPPPPVRSTPPEP